MVAMKQVRKLYEGLAGGRLTPEWTAACLTATHRLGIIVYQNDSGRWNWSYRGEGTRKEGTGAKSLEELLFIAHRVFTRLELPDGGAA